MVTNATGIWAGHLATLHPGRVGHLYSPGGQIGPFPFMPYALDNGAFSGFNEAEWSRLLMWSAMSGQRPLWCAVPDVVQDREGTLENWPRYAPMAKRYGFKLAFVAQDRMTFDDVPDEADMVFIGGGDEWKDAAIGPWCRAFPGRVHVGRVNGWPRLLACHNAGAVSVDGTGWLKTDRQRGILTKYLAETSGRARKTA